MKEKILRILCYIKIHHVLPTSYKVWQETDYNFHCTRCEKKWVDAKDIKEIIF